MEWAPARAASELDRMTKEIVELKIENQELKQDNSKSTLSLAENKKTIKKLWKDLLKSEEKCTNCRTLNQRNNEVQKKIKD